MHEVTGWACIVYHMELRKWRPIREFSGIPCGAMDNPYGKFIKKNVHIKGTLNWLSTNEDNNRLWIVSLNLSTEIFEMIILPEDEIIPDPNNEGVCIAALGDNICFS
ncbi:hypothetical protein RYX36_033101 [Vicia faba]